MRKKNRKLTNLNGKRKTKNNFKTVSEIRDSAARKITAKKTLDKYKKMRNAKNKKKFLVNEEELETIDYNKPTHEENLIEEESTLAAANKVFDLQVTAKKISDKYRKLRNSRAASQKTQTKEELSVKKRQIDKAAQITAKKILDKYRNIRFI